MLALEPGGPQEGEQKAHRRGQDPRLTFQFLDGGEDLCWRFCWEHFEGHDGAQAATLPVGDGRAWNVQAVAQTASADAVLRVPGADGRTRGAAAASWQVVESSREDPRAGL